MRRMLYVLMFFMIATMFVVSGCGEENIDSLIENVNHEGVKEHEMKNNTSTFQTAVNDEAYKVMYQAGILLKKWVPLVVVSLLLIGSILSEVFQKNMEIKKFALLTLRLQLPILILAFTYIYCALFGVLYQNRQIIDNSAHLQEIDFPTLWNKWCLQFIYPANALAAGSIFLGICMLEVFRKSNPTVVSFAKNTLCKKIPGLILLAVDVYAMLFYVFT